MSYTFTTFAGGHDGTGEGFIRTGKFQGVGNFDINARALKYSLLNHPNIPIYKSNLLEVNGRWILKKIGKVTVLVITAPCQGISAAASGSEDFGFLNQLNRLIVRCCLLIPLINADYVVVENVANLPRGEMRKLYNIIKYYLKTFRQYRMVDGYINALHCGVCQDRLRWICLMCKREYGKINMPPPLILDNTPEMDALKIINIDPTIEWIKGGYQDENGNHHKLIRSNQQFCPTITATPNLWNQDEDHLTIPQVMKFCGYRTDWIWDQDSFNGAWRLFGNSVLPGMAEVIANHLLKHMNAYNQFHY